MKILMYAPIFLPTIGGPATQCANLCRALSARGHEVVVLTIGERFENTSGDGYRVYRYPWKYTGTPLDKVIRWAVFPWYFNKILKKEKPEIIHCHSVSVLSMWVGYRAKRLGIPSVIKFAGDWVWETLSTHHLNAKDFEDVYTNSFLGKLMLKVERWGIMQFTMIWVPSKFRQSNIVRILGTEPPNLRLIYNSLDLPTGGFRKRSGTDPFVVVSASRFIPHKRIPFLIAAFAAMKNPNARLILIGSGDAHHWQEAHDVVEKEGVTAQVEFTGKLMPDELYPYFAKSDVYVSASVEEGFPNVFIEAMNFGLPIISADIGGCGEMVVEGETGFLVAAEDQQGFTDRLNRLYENAALRDRMAEQGYERSKIFSLKETMPQFEQLYADAINAKKS